MKWRKDKPAVTENSLDLDTTATTTGVEKDAPETNSDERSKSEDGYEQSSWDPNMDPKKVEATSDSLEERDLQAEAERERELDENSPYAEVRAAVQNWDQDHLPANTVRAWFLGMFFVTLGSGMNMLFSLRAPTIAIGMLVTEISAYPLGRGLEKILPTKVFKTPLGSFSFNPGPFNKKEHALVVIMANIAYAGGAAYSTFALEALKGFYKKDFSVGFAILLTLCTQVTGIAMAGLFRRFLVNPSSIIYPATLPSCALFNTLHDEIEKTDPATANGWSISRYRYYFYVLTGAFVWYWFPGWIWQGLSTFAWITWIKPDSVIVNQLFGGFSGLSLFPPFTIFTLDWTMIAGYFISPLTVPWHSFGNTLIGLVIFIWVTCSAIYYTGTWDAWYLPLSDSNSYDNTGQQYNVTRILTPEFTLNTEEYKAYSPIFLSVTFAMQYGLSFAATIALIVHTGLYHGVDLWKKLKRVGQEPDDVHVKMYSKYPQVPIWWYGILSAIMITLGFITVTKYDTQLPAWGYVLAIAIAAFFLIPVALIVAIYNIWIGLNVVCDVIIAYVLPGKPIAMLIFRSLSYNTLAQAVSFSEALKIGLYMKVPPMTVFFGQLAATLWSCLVQVGVFYWAFANIEDICAEEQPNKYSCPNGRVFYQNSIVWSVIGPKRIFASSSTYGSLRYFWLVGALFPLCLFALSKRFPKSSLRLLHAPIILGGVQQIPPAVPLNYLMWILVGFVFSKWIRSRYFGWWSRYNYITSAGLDAGLYLASIVIFLTLQLTKMEPPKWWGNDVVKSTLDQQGKAVWKKLPEGQTFGPTAGTW